jgi:predicted RNA-binding protein YlxR (DUF448 family)
MPASEAVGPVRTCVGCRGRDAKTHLVRVAMSHDRPGNSGGRIDVDLRARQPGRGAYVHLRSECMEQALGKGGLGRALRTRVDRAHTTALRQSLFALLAPSAPGNLPGSGEPSIAPHERMSRPNSEITSANPTPVGSDRATTELTRPAPPFVDEHRQARGQR